MTTLLIWALNCYHLRHSTNWLNGLHEVERDHQWGHLLSLSLYRSRNWGWKGANDLPKVTQQASGWARIGTKILIWQNSFPFIFFVTILEVSLILAYSCHQETKSNKAHSSTVFTLPTELTCNWKENLLFPSAEMVFDTWQSGNPLEVTQFRSANSKTRESLKQHPLIMRFCCCGELTKFIREAYLLYDTLIPWYWNSLTNFNTRCAGDFFS